jgi:chromosome segregation ATPase
MSEEIIKELEGKIEELERENSSLKEDVDLIQEEKNDLDDKIEELETRIEDLEDKLSESYNLDKIETELNSLDSFWKSRFDDDELKLLPSIKEKIINIFLYG